MGAGVAAVSQELVSRVAQGEGALVCGGQVEVVDREDDAPLAADPEESLERRAESGLPASLDDSQLAHAE